MVHLEPWTYQRIETSSRSIFHVSPRVMDNPTSPYEHWESKRVHRQLQQRTHTRDKNKPSGGQQDLEFLQNTQNDSSSYHRTHRASLLLYRVEHPPMLSTYYYYSGIFFTRKFLPKELATEQVISTRILVKFLKLQRVPSPNKREKYHSVFPSMNERYPPTVPRHKHKHKKPKTFSERVY